MRKQRIILTLVYLAAIVLQGTLCSKLVIFNGSPNIILSLAIVFSFFFENYDGVVLSVLFGLLQDMCYGSVFGISALLYLLICVGLKQTRFLVYRDNKLIMLIAAAACTFIYYAGYWLLAGSMLQLDLGFVYVIKCVPASILWNFLLVMIICHFARKMKNFMV